MPLDFGQLCRGVRRGFLARRRGFRSGFSRLPADPTEPDDGQSWHPRRNDHQQSRRRRLGDRVRHLLLTGHLRLSGDADWAKCGGATARRRRWLPRNDPDLSRCFGTSHRRGQRPGASVAPSEADAMKPQVTPVLAGIATAVLVAAAMEFGRRSGLLRPPPPGEITDWLLASGGTTDAARQRLANPRLHFRWL